MRAWHIDPNVDSEYLATSYWDRLIQVSPERALTASQAALESGGHAPVAHAVLLYATGRALLELGRVGDAAVALGTATELAVAEVTDAATRQTVLMTAAAVFTESGDIERALGHLEILERTSRGADLGRVRLQQAYVLQHAGRSLDALAALDQSDRLLAEAGTPQERFRVHINRGVVLLQQGELGPAEADFLAAAGLAADLGMTAAEGQCYANMGALYGRARRPIDALAAFERAAALLDACGRPDRITTWMEIDRAEVMMHSGLEADAVGAARAALATATPSRNAVLIGDALLLCARVELRAGLVRDATRRAAVAREHFAASGRDDMRAHAEGVEVLALLMQADATSAPDHLDRAADLAAVLRTSGWHQQADELAAERMRTAWRLDDWGAVRDDIADLRVHASGDRRDLRLLGWFAEAVGRWLDIDRSGSIAACRAGLDVLDDIVAEATDLETRSAAMRVGQDLSRWIIHVATETGDADVVLSASEGTRARALHEELNGPDRHRPLTEEGAARLLHDLRGRLHGRCLVQWVVARGRVGAVVCDESGNRLVDVADLGDVVRERDRLMVWLDRAAAEPDGSSSRALRAASLVDELLIEPLGLADDVSVVIVPVDELHGVPWSGLPSIASRPVVLSPSCRLWLDADRRASTPLRTVGFVSGPNVASDDLERTTLRRLFDRVDEATGAGATGATLRTMFGGHDLVHVAAHGRFRADRPLLSTFELADDVVTLHDSVPERVVTRLAVLSSCEGGAHQGAGGSEVLGLAAVLLARGAASVLAPLTVVRDLECGEFASEVHREMATGARFGLAVARVRARWLAEDDLSRWAVASSFGCFGSGASRRPDPSNG